MNNIENKFEEQAHINWKTVAFAFACISLSIASFFLIFGWIRLFALMLGMPIFLLMYMMVFFKIWKKSETPGLFKVVSLLTPFALIFAPDSDDNTSYTVWNLLFDFSTDSLGDVSYFFYTIFFQYLPAFAIPVSFVLLIILMGNTYSGWTKKKKDPSLQ